MWDNLADFAHTAQAAYRRNVWVTQPTYLEVWLEKDALSGIFEDALSPYGVTLNVGRGYDGWASIHNAAERYLRAEATGRAVTVLYFGDLDPSGEDMVRSLRERLEFFECRPEVVKCALTLQDMERYDLPPNCAKHTDTRREAFVATFGNLSVELDALPPDVLRARLIKEVESRMDLKALAKVRQVEVEERALIASALAKE
jgi:hypothetical protein